MGYRSAVEAVFYTRNEEEYPLLKLYVEENFPKFWANDADEDTLTPIKATNVWGYHFIANNVKWYESYPEIQEFNEFVVKFNKLLMENERARPTWAYEFVRIGEEMNDVEEERSDNAEFILCVSREIQLLT
jgi:hypothetical protein